MIKIIKSSWCSKHLSE